MMASKKDALKILQNDFEATRVETRLKYNQKLNKVKTEIDDHSKKLVEKINKLVVDTLQENFEISVNKNLIGSNRLQYSLKNTRSDIKPKKSSVLYKLLTEEQDLTDQMNTELEELNKNKQAIERRILLNGVDDETIELINSLGKV